MSIGQVNWGLLKYGSMEDWKSGSLEVLKHSTLREHKQPNEQQSRLVKAGDYGDTSADVEMNGCADFFKRDGQLVFDGLFGDL